MKGKVKFKQSECVWDALSVPEEELRKELEAYIEKCSELRGLTKTEILEVLYPKLTYPELFQAIVIGHLLFVKEEVKIGVVRKWVNKII
jgi:hypothetical protein